MKLKNNSRMALDKLNQQKNKGSNTSNSIFDNNELGQISYSISTKPNPINYSSANIITNEIKSEQKVNSSPQTNNKNNQFGDISFSSNQSNSNNFPGSNNNSRNSQTKISSTQSQNSKTGINNDIFSSGFGLKINDDFDNLNLNNFIQKPLNDAQKRLNSNQSGGNMQMTITKTTSSNSLNKSQ